MIKIGIVGLGHWGPNYIRCLNSIKGVDVVWCCDLMDNNLAKVSQSTNIRLTTNYREILDDSSVDAVVVATPASTHHKIIKECLLSDKDILAEKPLTLEPGESMELCRIADEKNKILMVGHTFLYNPGIRKIKELFEEGDLGKIYYLNATRTHLGLIREDVNAVWDLAPHDISIFNYLLNSSPIMVNAIGACHLKKGREDVGFINLVYPDNVIANIEVSWEDSNKERTVRIVGSKARVVFDDIDNLERVKLFKKGIHITEEYDGFGEFQLQLRDGDIISPMLKLYEPLKEMCLHFVECLEKRKRPLTDGKFGYEIVKIMKDIEIEMQKNARIVENVQIKSL